MVQGGVSLRKEFRDVVSLHNVHPRDDGDASMSPECRAAYREEADRKEENPHEHLSHVAEDGTPVASVGIQTADLSQGRELSSNP